MNNFVGMVEAPLIIRPYLAGLSRAELFALMTTGMATIAGTMMVLSAGILSPVVPDAMGHILIASIISAPAALLVSGVMLPETDAGRDRDAAPLVRQSESVMDAVTRGTLDAIPLMLNIMAILVVLVALVTLTNQVLGRLGPDGGQDNPQRDRRLPRELARPPAGALSERSRLIMTYALCGFANFGGLGIMIGGMGSHGARAASRGDRRPGVWPCSTPGPYPICLPGCRSGSAPGTVPRAPPPCIPTLSTVRKQSADVFQSLVMTFQGKRRVSRLG